MKPLDFVKTPKGSFGIITEVGGSGISIDFIGPSNGEKNAWWVRGELEVIDNLPNVLARNMAHPFGSNKRTVDTFFPIDNKEA